MFADIDQRGIVGGRTRTLLTVTDAALVVIDPSTNTFSWLVLRQGDRTGDVIGINKDDPTPDVHGRPSPFGSAKEARKNDRLLVQTDRNILSLAAISLEFLSCPSVRRGCALREHLRGQDLPREQIGRAHV